MGPVNVPFLGLILMLCTRSAVQARKSEGFQMRDLRVDCSKDGMLVTVDFDGPFDGIIYSRGYYTDPSCQYVGGRGGHLRSSTVTFRVPLHGCGTVSEGGGREHAMRLENTLVIQGDPDIQEAWDLARRIRCVWQDTIARTVTAKPFQVSQPRGSEPLSLAEDHINAVMEVQEGRGPFNKPASGYLHLGEESSLVVYLQDPSRKLDARMVDCRAMTGPEAPAQLVLTDGQGCALRPDLISPFYKTRETRNTGADLIMYTHFRAFRLPDSSGFNIRCNMQVCAKLCPDYCTNRTRSKRDEPGFRYDSPVDSKGDLNGPSQMVDAKTGFRGDSRDGWRGISPDSVREVNLRLKMDRKTDFKEAASKHDSDVSGKSSDVFGKPTPGVLEDNPSDYGKFAAFPKEDSVIKQVAKTPGILLEPTELVPEDIGDDASVASDRKEDNHTDHHPRGHKVLEHRVEVLTEEEVRQKKQLCFVQSSWVAICGVLGAGYLCLGIVVWVLILRIRAYGSLVKSLKEKKATG